jgi:protein-arginine kinase activator protein McsA
MNCPLSGKPCDKFKEFHITNIENGKVETINVCEDCISLTELEKQKELKQKQLEEDFEKEIQEGLLEMETKKSKEETNKKKEKLKQKQLEKDFEKEIQEGLLKMEAKQSQDKFNQKQLEEDFEKEIKEGLLGIEQKDENENKCCPSCGLSLNQLIKKSRFGCADCYDFFHGPVLFALEKMHYTPENPKKQKTELRHTGRVPTQFKKKQAELTDPKDFLQELKNEQEKTIKEENYELANELKSIIIGFDSLVKRLEEYKDDPDQFSLIRAEISKFIFLYREKKLN